MSNAVLEWIKSNPTTTNDRLEHDLVILFCKQLKGAQVEGALPYACALEPGLSSKMVPVFGENLA
jgi:hypothetical protein